MTQQQKADVLRGLGFFAGIEFARTNLRTSAQSAVSIPRGTI